MFWKMMNMFSLKPRLQPFLPITNFLYEEAKAEILLVIAQLRDREDRR